MNPRAAARLLLLLAAAGGCAPGWAQDQPGMDQSSMNHVSMDHASMAPSKTDQTETHDPKPDHSGTDHATQQAPRPAQSLPVPTDADRAAAFPVLHAGHDMHASPLNTYLLVDRMEVWDADPGTGQAWEARGWMGGDVNRAWLRSEGERTGSRTQASELELLYGRSVSAWWDVTAGVRHDFAPGTPQDWLALGVQGMAPYKFEVSATAYLGSSGRIAASFEAEYELLLTQRLVLQPRLELRLAGQDDAQRRVGAGLQKMEAGLRLRYEINRHFAPYLGLVQERTFGGTADYHRDQGEPTDDTRVVAGLRFWF